ncbi:hypothetical protein BH09ACT11_BH09ACT11_04890 [soil metagenome]
MDPTAPTDALTTDAPKQGPLALYRRYRPETFTEVIGQEHVTEPLRSALAHNRVNHAYLFSGPRGCGKTTSARILARALNCEKAPIADPCGECDSCRDLARGGPGSIDVIEIDAASHGGVDDARDLREKAYFAPVKSRYKVYIIDEAHMVTTQGFNALLKLVEEPPDHLRFIFATTEPDKVIATIRSRTHHYPFRLIPPRLLSSYVAQLCELEGIGIEPAALPLIVRAGAGSARDTLSVLDQLIGGSGADGVTYDLAVGLLGYTPDSLLDGVVDAIAASDGAGIFAVVDRVIETGQDPRRFTEDLLRRLRDLVIVKAVPEASATGLIDVAEDQAERLTAQAARFGAADLSRAADLIAAGLTEMRGATAPRLLLELILARVLLPGADHSTDGLAARMDRLERRMSISPGPAAAEPLASPAVAPQPEPIRDSVPGAVRRELVATPTAESAPPAAAAAAAHREPGDRADASTRPPWPEAPIAESAESIPQQAPVAAQPPAAGQPSAAATIGLLEIRTMWPDVLDAVKARRRVAWMILSSNAQVLGLDGDVLTIGFNNTGARDSFVASKADEVVQAAIHEVIGSRWRIEPINDPGATPRTAEQHPIPSSAPKPRAAPSAAMVSAREAATAAPVPGEPVDPVQAADDEVSGDDPIVASDDLSGAELLTRELGAQIIEDIPN